MVSLAYILRVLGPGPYVLTDARSSCLVLGEPGPSISSRV